MADTKTYTTNYNLVKPGQDDFYNVDDFNSNADKIDAALHTHKTASILDHPDNSVTDAKIGNRTITDTVTAAAGAGTITNLLSKLGNMIKRITGKSNWYTAPAITLEDVSNHTTATSAAHAASAISSTATGDVAATNVQAAIAELASEKLALGGGDMKGAINETMVTMASAATMAIGAAAGNLISVTGTTTITAFDTVQSGVKRTLRFASSLTINYNSLSLLLPGGSNITVAAGDIMEFASFGNGNWRCSNYQPTAGNVTKDKSSTITGAITLSPNNLNRVAISTDMNGSIEIGDLVGNATAGSVSPFIDFHYAVGSIQDYNVRMINNRDGGITFAAPTGACEVDVFGGSNSYRHGFMLGNKGIYGYLDYDTSGSQVRLSALNNLAFGFNSNDVHNTGTFTERMRLTSAGRLGIKTTLPAYDIDVVGNINASTGVYSNGVAVAPGGYGLGTDVVLLTAGQENSTLLKTGRFFWPNTIPGSPTINSGFLFRDNRVNSQLTDEFTDAISNSKYFRSYMGGVWSAWKQIATTDLIPAGAGAVKAHVNFSYSGGVVTIRNSFNVSSVVRTSGGQYTINFAAPLASANYTVQCTAVGLGTGVRQGLVTSEYMSAANTYGTKTANAIAILTVTNNDSDTTVADVGSCNVTILQ